MSPIKNLLFILFLLLVCTPGTGIQAQNNPLPSVFITGEYPEAFDLLSRQYPGSLISASNNDMDIAFKNWRLFLSDIERYSEEIDFDLKGIKIMLQVYWNGDGKVEHLSYWPKPECRNIPEDDLVAFFKSFVRNYEFSVKSDEKFTHSGAAEFPTMGILLKK